MIITKGRKKYRSSSSDIYRSI